MDWDDQYKSVVFRAKGFTFALPVGKKYSDDFMKELNTWKRLPISTATVDYGGEPFVPLLDVAKKLGMEVRYDFPTARTHITSNITVTSNTIMHANTKQKLIALTFDDGPESKYTPLILDILKEKAAPATFFVLGKQIKQFPEMMKRIVNEGHGIANHSYHHPDLRRVYTARVFEEIRSTQAQMQNVVGRRPDIFRPPYGAFTKADVRALNDIGMRNILWSVDTLDWSGTSAEEILEIIRRDSHPGAIILQHNFQSEASLLDGTVEALPKMIDELRDHGYKLVTIQTLLGN